MQITFPAFYKEFSCIADACPDTCCAEWQIMIDDKKPQEIPPLQGAFPQPSPQRHRLGGKVLPPV